MGEGTDGGLPGQRGRLQLYLLNWSVPWGSSTGNATGEVEVLARGAAVDSPSTLRSLMERRLSASQHRGKMRHAVLAIAAKSRSSQDIEVPPSKYAIPCGGCCGSPLGRGGPGGPSSSPAAAPPRPRQLFSDRRKGFSENPNVFSEKANFLAKFLKVNFLLCIRS